MRTQFNIPYNSLFPVIQ